MVQTTVSWSVDFPSSQPSKPILDGAVQKMRPCDSPSRLAKRKHNISESSAVSCILGNCKAKMDFRGIQNNLARCSLNMPYQLQWLMTIVPNSIVACVIALITPVHCSFQGEVLQPQRRRMRKWSLFLNLVFYIITSITIIYQLYIL